MLQSDRSLLHGKGLEAVATEMKRAENVKEPWQDQMTHWLLGSLRGEGVGGTPILPQVLKLWMFRKRGGLYGTIVAMRCCNCWCRWPSGLVNPRIWSKTGVAQRAVGIIRLK